MAADCLVTVGRHPRAQQQLAHPLSTPARFSEDPEGPEHVSVSVRGKLGQSRVHVKCLSQNDAPLPKRASERLPVGGYLEVGDGAELSNQKSMTTSPSACLMGFTSSFTWPRRCFLHPPLPARCSPGPQPLQGGRGGESPPVAKVPSVFPSLRAQTMV